MMQMWTAWYSRDFGNIVLVEVNFDGEGICMATEGNQAMLYSSVGDQYKYHPTPADALRALWEMLKAEERVFWHLADEAYRRMKLAEEQEVPDAKDDS